MKLSDYMSGWGLGIVFLFAAQVLVSMIDVSPVIGIALATGVVLLAMVAAQTFMADRQAAAMWAMMMLGIAPVLVTHALFAQAFDLEKYVWPFVGGFLGGRFAGLWASVAKRASFMLVTAHAVWVGGVVVLIAGTLRGGLPIAWIALAIFGAIGSATFLARGRRKWRAYDRLAQTGQDAKHLGKLRVELEGGEIVTAVRAAELPIGPVVIEPSATMKDGAYRVGRSLDGRIVEGTRAELQTTGEDLAFRYMSAALAWTVLACAPLATALLR